jgi:hypothetical protein
MELGVGGEARESEPASSPEIGDSRLSGWGEAACVFVAWEELEMPSLAKVSEFCS